MIRTYDAIVCFSGGQDSTTVLGMAVEKFGAAHVRALTADYGQRHGREIESARSIAEFFGVKHDVVDLSNTLIGRSPLTNLNAELEVYDSPEQMAEIIGDRREVTFVPFRNPLFLTVAANRAVVHGATTIWTGICQEDNANYDDCRDVFRLSMQDMLEKAIGSDHRKDAPRLSIVAPLMHKSKAETVKLAASNPGIWDALALSHTAYSNEFPPLTQDHATVLRAQGFRDAGMPDPLIVRAVHDHLMVLPDSPNYTAFREVILHSELTLREKLKNIRQGVKG